MRLPVFIALSFCAVNCLAAQLEQWPEDSGRAYIVVVTAEQPTDQDKTVVDWFDNDPTLSTLAERAHFVRFTPGDPLYQERYAECFAGDRLPIVFLARPSGGVEYKVSGDRLPRSPQALASQMLAWQQRSPFFRVPDTVTDAVSDSVSNAIGESLRKNLPLLCIIGIAIVIVFGGGIITFAVVIAAILYFARPRP